MKKLYVIRTQDFFNALTKGQIPECSLKYVGSLWTELLLTEEEKNKYTFPICELT